MHAIQLNGRLRTPSRPRQQTSPSFTLAPRPPDPPPTTTRVFAALSPKKTTPEALRSLEEQWRNRRRDKLQELVKSKLTAADDEPALERPQAVKRDAEPPRRPTPSRPRIASLRGEEPRRRSTAAQSKSKPSVPALHSVQSTEIPLPSPPTTPESKLEHTTPPVPLRSPHRAVVNGKAAKARVNDRHKFSSDQPQDIKRHTTPRTLKVDLTGAAHDVSPILVGCLPPGVFQLVGENTTSIRVHRRKAGASKASMTIVKGDRSFVVLEHGRLLRTSKGGRFEKDVWLGEEVETWREVQELVERLKRKTPKVSFSKTLFASTRPNGTPRPVLAHQTTSNGHARSHVQRRSRVHRVSSACI